MTLLRRKIVSLPSRGRCLYRRMQGLQEFYSCSRSLLVVSVRPTTESKGLLRVSRGVSEGMLLTPIRPVYPAIAKAARVEGSVVVEAVISRTGTIESLHVVSGPQMLQNAALDAIREARYRPYRLNGEPTEVQTTITVIFHMGG